MDKLAIALTLPLLGTAAGAGGLCVDASAPIPDGSLQPVASQLLIVGGGTVGGNLEVDVEITHTWVGDLVIDLIKDGITVRLMDRPGVPASAFGCSNDNMQALFSPSSSSPVESTCHPPPVAAISGFLEPEEPLSAFNGLTMNGTWTLEVSDHWAGDAGVLETWCISSFADGTGGAVTGGTGGSPTPSTSVWGVAILIAFFLGASMHLLRDRGGASHRAIPQHEARYGG